MTTHDALLQFMLFADYVVTDSNDDTSLKIKYLKILLAQPKIGRHKWAMQLGKEYSVLV